MAVKRITMQDIADACGLSRNTVSKIFNNRGAVPAETRKLVFQTAQDLSYGQFTEEMPKDVKKNTRNVAVIAMTERMIAAGATAVRNPFSWRSPLWRCAWSRLRRECPLRKKETAPSS